MKNPTKLLFVALLMLLTSSQIVKAQISGTVFRDYNGNGVKNNTATFNEPFVSGITVKAYNAANVQLGTTKTTDAAGAYSFSVAEIPSSTKVRVEFGGLVNGDASSFTGTGNGTNIQFATAGSTVNYAINTADDYWNNTAQSNPNLLGIVYGQGDYNHVNSANAAFGVTQINNNTTGHTPTIVNVASQSQVGCVWGMGYQKLQDRYFFANFLKRHVGFGPKGVGGVYMANLVGANYAFSGGFTLQGVVPSNSAVPLDMGTVNRVSSPSTSDNYLATGTDLLGKDLDAFGKVGKIGFGDIDIDETNQQLILVNLSQQRLVTLDVSGNTASLNNATLAALSPLTKAYNILSLPGVPTSANGQLRPFALKIYKGKGYLGVVMDASSTPRDSTNLAGYILSFDPTNIAAGFNTEININFNYRTSTSNANTNRWHAWADTWANVSYAGSYARYPQPMISDLEFDENGGLNISITDRFGHQLGAGQTIPVAGSATIIADNRVSGDILHACRVSGAWVMEGTSGSCAVTNNKDNKDGYGDGQTVGTYEYYDDESGDAAAVLGFGEFTIGAMAKLMGTNKLVQTIGDPTSAPGVTGEPYFFSGGMHWFDVVSGSWSNWTALYDGSDAGAPAGTFMKGNGLGDIEFATSSQPIQIGNRIWLDANLNGLQDADETTAGVATGTTVNLYTSTGTLVATTTTDAFGNYYFSSLNVANDPRKPAAWTGLGNSILPGFDYKIEVALPLNTDVTQTDISSNGFDNIDNDASKAGLNAVVLFNSASTNHNFDIGIKLLASLGNVVWLDEGAGGGVAKDGLQNGGEPVIVGVPVSLYQTGPDGIVGTADDVFVSSTTTNASGFYLFDKLQPSTSIATQYNVRVTPSTSYSITTQTNTSDDNNSTGLSTIGSDINPLGMSYSIDLSAGENNPNVDAGLINALILPIKMESFTALPKGSQVNLQWSVSSQINVAKYEVETSVDTRVFNKIATVLANTSNTATYDAVHSTPIVGTNYYRIKTIDNDGTFNYSDIRKVNIEKAGDVVIYPNPVSTGVANLKLTGSIVNKAATVSVYSMEGKLISQKRISTTNQTEMVNVNNLPNGTYILRLVTDSEIVNKKIQISK